ncbi:MAG: tripartite tricarboxylate transporter substrate binding protein [Beijerinckiaceae bacterium]|nr:tripartite tricarboxylate transporter substrate binding protein [Beijerinckiaceae bacterium]
MTASGRFRRGARAARAGALLVIAAPAFVATPLLAQTYPGKEVKLIIPFPTAGVTDLNARILAKHLSKLWSQPVTPVNMPGDGGTKGTMYVLGSPKDGYTMMMSATGQGTQNPAIESKLPYKWDEPTLVGRTSVSPLVFVVKGDSPWNGLGQVISDVKASPANYRYGTSGPGGVGSIALALLFGGNGVDVQKMGRVVLQGGAPLLNAVATGETHFAAQYLAEMGPELASGKLKGLAVSTAERVKQLPNVPTSREAGFDSFTLIGWNGVVGPADLPREIVARWEDSLRTLASDRDFVTETEASGAEVAFLSSAAFKETLRVEYEEALRQVEKLGLRR